MTLEITTNRLHLRQLDNDDLQDIFKQFSDSDMCKYFSDPPCTTEEASDIIAHYQYKNGDTQIRYCVTDKSTGVFIGTCGFHLWDKTNRRVEIGYDIWKKYWRKGYAKEVIKPLLDVCFDELGVECVYALTHVDNIASEKLLLSVGFSLDGELRGWVNVSGEQQTQKCFTLLKTDWRIS